MVTTHTCDFIHLSLIISYIQGTQILFFRGPPNVLNWSCYRMSVHFTGSHLQHGYCIICKHTEIICISVFFLKKCWKNWGPNQYMHIPQFRYYPNVWSIPFTTGCPFLNSNLKPLFLVICLDSAVVTTARWYLPWLASSKTSNMSPTREV